MLHSALIINGQLTSDTQLTGTATIDTNGTLDSTSVPWNASGPADSLPAVGDMHSARVEGQVGTLSFWLDDNNTVTSFFLQNVSFGTCVGRPVTLRASFATPIPLEGRRMLWVSFGGTGLRFLSISGNRYADVYSGYLSLTGVYAEDCGADLKWTTAELATPTAEPTSTAAPSATATLAAKTLPATGAGARQSNRSLPVAGLAAAGAALVFVAAAFARRVR